MKPKELKLKITKNIPVPHRAYSMKHWSEVLDKMKIGYSIVVDKQGLVGSCRRVAHRKGMDVSSQTTPDGKGWRIWRTK